MPQWVLLCPECETYFTHSLVESSAVSWLGTKPELSAEGQSLQCPNCNKTSTFMQHDLRYSGV
jgi:hypothetical protein